MGGREFLCQFFGTFTFRNGPQACQPENDGEKPEQTDTDEQFEPVVFPADMTDGSQVHQGAHPRDQKSLGPGSVRSPQGDDEIKQEVEFAARTPGQGDEHPDEKKIQVSKKGDLLPLPAPYFLPDKNREAEYKINSNEDSGPMSTNRLEPAYGCPKQNQGSERCPQKKPLEIGNEEPFHIPGYPNRLKRVRRDSATSFMVG